mmetsp:Transcript_56636/g.124192  ORF Transcript_56636/g.124192 Transcript_56636/m.124192 type:complete len:269 (+) Transcript_56636:69-875(+)|eukprot:CAMPEP_0204295796 /NCGR_PEP_ID=MMETSP0468-20130131/70326_1 /ASSEMBLY_ACC=CAM_ASM_000383 /TAXON_ID=2969 /ORGANISM="Oxyrrhis marina" /LENGTH=268 /DNA_ID=CAMNT_0051274453 /DNA_START=19 /DNA_END=825 /DNA_ORIENTATION=-
MSKLARVVGLLALGTPMAVMHRLEHEECALEDDEISLAQLRATRPKPQLETHEEMPEPPEHLMTKNAADDAAFEQFIDHARPHEKHMSRIHDGVRQTGIWEAFVRYLRSKSFGMADVMAYAEMDRAQAQETAQKGSSVHQHHKFSEQGILQVIYQWLRHIPTSVVLAKFILSLQISFITFFMVNGAFGVEWPQPWNILAGCGVLLNMAVSLALLDVSNLLSTSLWMVTWWMFFGLFIFSGQTIENAFCRRRASPKEFTGQTFQKRPLM